MSAVVRLRFTRGPASRRRMGQMDCETNPRLRTSCQVRETANTAAHRYRLDLQVSDRSAQAGKKNRPRDPCGDLSDSLIPRMRRKLDGRDQSAWARSLIMEKGISAIPS